jgi:hypothetical protein
MTPPFPIERYLVPPSESPLDGATAQSTVLAKGLPETIQLDGEVSLAVVLPTGVATAWRDADPGALVSSSDGELAAWTPAPSTSVGDVERAPVRLLVLLRGNPAASIPLVAGLHRVAADDGGTTGAFLELRIVAWALYAGNVRGGGDYGSSLKIEWRRVGSGTPRFEAPPLDPHVAQRLRRRFRMESTLGPVAPKAVA